MRGAGTAAQVMMSPCQSEEAYVYVPGRPAVASRDVWTRSTGRVLRSLREGGQDYVLVTPLMECKRHVSLYLALPYPITPSSASSQVAVKVTDKPLSTACTRCSKACCVAVQEQQARTEIANLRRLSSAANVISLIDAMEDEVAIYTVLPYMEGGDLCDRLLALPNRRQPEAVVRGLMIDITQGMRQLKASGMTHGCVRLW